MKILGFIPSVLTLFVILGIIFGFYIELKSTVVIIISFVILVLLWISHYFSNKSFTKNVHFNIAGYVSFFVIGICAITLQQLKNNKLHYSHFITSSKKSVLLIEKQLKSNAYYYKYEATILQLDKQKTIGKILLNIKKDSSLNTLKIDDRILVLNDFKSIKKPKNPYQFNYKKYLEKNQIYHQITISKNEFKLIDSKSVSLNGLASRFREKINISLKKHSFNEDKLAIINALLLGQRQQISKELLNDYQAAGAVHILAVSGLHIGVLLLLFNFLLKPIHRFKNGKTISLFIVIILLWLYAILAGLSASIIRAVTMYTAIAIGIISNRKSNTLNNLFISMFVLVLIHPLYIFSIGFQLSYLAVFSIVLFYPLFIKLYNPAFWLFKKPWQLFSISCSAQLGILPLSLFYFHQFPSLFFVSSMIIIPCLALILGFGILVIGLSLLNILPNFIAISYGFVIELMNRFVSFIAKQEAFLFKEIPFSMSIMIMSYIFIILCFQFINKLKIKRLVTILIAVILIQLVFVFKKYQLGNSQEIIIFNTYKNTLIVERNGKETLVFQNEEQHKNKAILNSYQIGKGNLVTTKTDSIKDIFILKNKKMLVINHLGIYNLKELKPEYVLIRESPKINLERLIQKLKPKIIIADASNYKSDVLKWRKTCEKFDVKFHSTYNKGAFRISL